MRGIILCRKHGKREENDMDGSVALPTNERIIRQKLDKGFDLPEFAVKRTYSSHMVLQRDREIRIDGFCDRIGSAVKGSFAGFFSECTVAEGGLWSLFFPAMEWTDEPLTLEVWDERGKRVILDDILIGDVWMIGGQSNAELNLAPCAAYEPVGEILDTAPVRLFTQTQAYVYTHQEYCGSPQPDVISPSWRWMRQTEEAAMSFSAMGWYFARELKRHTPVPQGLVMIAAGGACIRELWPEEIAHREGYFFGGNVRESGYYNALIHPFIGMPFRAMLFFQGESEGGDRGLAEKYDKELKMLVDDERASWGFDFPFYNVQLSDYREEGKSFFPYHDTVRIKQFDAQNIIDGYYLTTAMDLGAPEGYPDWAHSPKKRVLGERLARLVLANEYGLLALSDASCPIPVEARQTKEGISVRFSDKHAPLILSEDIKGFTVGNYGDMQVCKAKAVTEYEVLVNAVSDRVNYAYFMPVDGKKADLYGKNGEPTPAFSMAVKE